MTDYIVAGTDLTAVANKIRSKGGTSAQLEFPSEFISAIEAIEGGGGGVVKTLLYSFNESQGNSWINTEIDTSGIETLMFEDVRSGDVIKAAIIDVADIAVYTGGADVYTNIYTQTRPMNVRIYNGYLYVSYNGTGAATNVTNVYSYEETSGGGGSTNILSGTDVPTSSVGSDGAVYLQYGSSDDLITATSLKVNGSWQPLVGSDIDDVNTGGN